MDVAGRQKKHNKSVSFLTKHIELYNKAEVINQGYFCINN